MALPDELKADPEDSADDQFRCLSIHAVERRRDIERYAGSGPKAPAKNNHEGRWDFWEGHTVEDVLDAVRARRSVARRTAPLRVGASRATRPLFFMRRGRAPTTPPPRRTPSPPPPQPVVDEEDDPEMKKVLADSLDTVELDELARWPGLFQVLRDSAMEQQMEPEPEQTNIPPEMLGMKWCWTGPLPESYEDDPMEEVEQARPPPRRTGPPPPPVADWPWAQPVFIDLSGDNDDE